jgi:hypothetical protein
MQSSAVTITVVDMCGEVKRGIYVARSRVNRSMPMCRRSLVFDTKKAASPLKAVRLSLCGP